MLRRSRKQKAETAAAASSDSPAVPSSVLPADVLMAIEGVSVYPRGEGRMIIQFPDSGGWYHGIETNAKMIRKMYPELNDAQVVRACRALSGAVSARLQVQAAPGARRRNWATDY